MVSDHVLQSSANSSPVCHCAARKVLILSHHENARSDFYCKVSKKPPGGQSASSCAAKPNALDLAFYQTAKNPMGAVLHRHVQSGSSAKDLCCLISVSEVLNSIRLSSRNIMLLGYKWHRDFAGICLMLEKIIAGKGFGNAHLGSVLSLPC